jgi:flagellar protein FliL
LKENPKLKADPKADAVVPKASNKKMLVLIIAALAVVLAGGAGWYFTQGKAGAAHKEVKAEPPIFVPIEPFTVNLQPETGEQFLQTALTLHIADPAQVELIKLNMPIVRDRLLLLLSSKKASELISPEGKKQLSGEIVASVNTPFAPKGAAQKVSGVSFTSFIIQ